MKNISFKWIIFQEKIHALYIVASTRLCWYDFWIHWRKRQISTPHSHNWNSLMTWSCVAITAQCPFGRHCVCVCDIMSDMVPLFKLYRLSLLLSVSRLQLVTKISGKAIKKSVRIPRHRTLSCANSVGVWGVRKMSNGKTMWETQSTKHCTFFVYFVDVI